MNIIQNPLPKGAKYNTPSIIIVHSMSEFFFNEDEGKHHATKLLENLGLSAHRLVTPDGDMIKCREDNQGAYHAKGHNTNTLGIEILMEGLHTYEEFIEKLKHPWVTDDQFKNTAYIVSSWMAKWSIPIDNVVTHAQIDPARKHDPGEGFPMDKFKELLITSNNG